MTKEESACGYTSMPSMCLDMVRCLRNAVTSPFNIFLSVRVFS